MSVVRILKSVLGDESGATAVEYGLIVSLIVIAIIGALNTFASETIKMWDGVSEKMEESVN